MKINLFLIVDIDKKKAWTVTRKSKNLPFGQFTYELTIDVPDGWFTDLGHIQLQMPDPPDKEMMKIAQDLGLRSSE